MYWSKVKSILIVLFVIVNFILFTNILFSMNQTIQVSRDTINNTVEILARANISIDPKLIDSESSRMHFTEISNICADKDTLASRLMSGNVEKTAGPIFQSETETLSFTNTVFQYENHLPDERNIPTESSAKSIALRLVRDKGFSVSDKNIDTQKAIDSGYKVILQQLLEDKPIFESYLAVCLFLDGTYSIEGFWTVEERTSIINRHNIPLRHITGILVDFASQKGSEVSGLTITSIELGYSIGNRYSHKLLSVSPCYKITMSNSVSYLYDANTGEFIYSYQR